MRIVVVCHETFIVNTIVLGEPVHLNDTLLDMHVRNLVRHFPIVAAENLVTSVTPRVSARQNPAARELGINRPAIPIATALTACMRDTLQLMAALRESLERNILVRHLTDITQIVLQVTTVICSRVELEVHNRSWFVHGSIPEVRGISVLPVSRMVIVPRRVSTEPEAPTVVSLHRLVRAPVVTAAVVLNMPAASRVSAVRAVVDWRAVCELLRADVASRALEPAAKTRLGHHAVRRRARDERKREYGRGEQPGGRPHGAAQGCDWGLARGPAEESCVAGALLASCCCGTAGGRRVPHVMYDLGRTVVKG